MRKVKETGVMDRQEINGVIYGVQTAVASWLGIQFRVLLQSLGAKAWDSSGSDIVTP